MKTTKTSNYIVPSFETAIQTWSKGLDKVYELIIRLWQVPHLAKRLGIDSPMSQNQILDIYREWLWLLSKLDHPLEQEFFKASWFPLSDETYNYYFDLASEEVVVFEQNYFSGTGINNEGCSWDKNHFIKSWQELSEVQNDSDGGKAWLQDLNLRHMIQFFEKDHQI